MTTRILAGGVCLLLLPAVLEGERLVHRPEPGQKIVRTYRVAGEMHMVELSVEAGGEEHAPDEVPEVSIRGESRYVVRDELQDVQEGELRRVRRTYETLEDSRAFVGPDGEATTSERESELDGETLVFAWDEEEGEWKVTQEEADLDQELLDGLRVDLSLAAFLPPDEVEEGATWQVSGDEAGALLRPLGELGLRAEEEPESEEAREFSNTLQDSMEGTIEATYRGTREEQGLVLAVVELEIDVRMEASVEMAGEGSQEVSIERVLTGELLWNTAAARLHSVKVEGRTAETTTQIRGIPTPEGEVEVRQRQVFEGDRSYSIEVAEG